MGGDKCKIEDLNGGGEGEEKGRKGEVASFMLGRWMERLQHNVSGR